MQTDMNGEKRQVSAGLILWGVAALLVLAIAACGIVLAGQKAKEKHRLQEMAENREEKAVDVRTTVITPQTITSHVYLPGRLEPSEAVDLPARKPGCVADIFVEKGDRVEEHQSLMRIDPETWRISLERCEIEEREAAKVCRQWKDLVDAGALSTNDYEAALTRLEMARLAVRQARLDLELCEVRSPIAGIVDDRTIDEGEYVHEGVTVFTVVDIDPLKLVLDVPEREIRAIRGADGLELSATSLPGREFPAMVSFVAARSNPMSNTYRSEAVVGDTGGELFAGTIVNVKLMHARIENAIVVPRVAVMPTKGEHIVFVVEGDRAIRRTVRLGSVVGASLQHIDSGLSPGDVLVVEGQRSLEDGTLVNNIAD